MICLVYMTKTKHIIQLSMKELVHLQGIIRKGKHNARTINRARILILSHTGEKKDAIASRLDSGRSTVQRIRDRYHEGGLTHALAEDPRPGAPRKIDDSAEAHLVAVSCENPPDGHPQWTMELLKERMVADGKVAKDITSVALWYHLDKRGIKPWREKNVVHPNTHAGVH